ncbi:hypothetical protein GGH95_002595, partial [Coemansia sp. RSA 1836]
MYRRITTIVKHALLLGKAIATNDVVAFPRVSMLHNDYKLLESQSNSTYRPLHILQDEHAERPEFPILVTHILGTQHQDTCGTQPATRIVCELDQRPAVRLNVPKAELGVGDMRDNDERQRRLVNGEA